MRQSFSKIVLTVFLMCVVSISAATEQPTPIRRLIDVSGLSVQLPEVSDITLTAVLGALAKEGVAPGTLQALEPKIADVLRPENFLQAIESEVESSFTPEEIEELLAWFESDLGLKMTAAEVRASTVEATLDMLMQAEALMQDEDRVALAGELREITKRTDTDTSQPTRILLLTTAALWGIDNPGVPFNLAGVRLYLKGYDQAIRAELERFNALAYVYTYRDIDLAELDQYKAFLATPAAVKLFETVKRAKERQYERAALALAEAASAIIGGRTLAQRSGVS